MVIQKCEDPDHDEDDGLAKWQCLVCNKILCHTCKDIHNENCVRYVELNK
jgi:hypothetical protein